MNRFRPWVAELHGGQLVILIALQMFGGVVTVAGFFVVADRVETHYAQQASLAEQYKREKTLWAQKLYFDVAKAKTNGYTDAEIDKFLLEERGDTLRKALRRAGISDSEISADSARIAKAYQASRVFPISLMIVGGALLLCMWAWVLLSLWWWLGARKKPEGAQ